MKGNRTRALALVNKQRQIDLRPNYQMVCAVIWFYVLILFYYFCMFNLTGKLQIECKILLTILYTD